MESDDVSPNKPSNDGFLSGFIEAGMEMPPDGLNGDNIVHYEGEHSNCELNVRLSNGLREGMGTIKKEGVPFIQIEYRQGVPNGSVCRMNGCGMVEMRGQVMNGRECGLFEEYDDANKVVWRGYYRNGVRYSEVIENEELPGYYDERSVKTGRLLSVAQYDDSLHDKNGRCFEYEDDSLKSECVYEKGVKKHTIREFVDGKMTEYYENGRIKYEGEYNGTMVNGFVWEGEGKEYDENGKTMVYSGGWKGGKREGQGSEWDENGILFIGTWNDGKREHGIVYERDENGVIKRGLLYEDGEMNQDFQEFNGSIMTTHLNGKLCYEGGFKFYEEYGFLAEGKGKGYDMDEETLVYSGEWRNDKPNGLGTYYKHGRAVYTGEWKDGTANGNGEEMDENGRVVFEGEWKDGMGKGKEVDESGTVVYEGEWNNGKRNGVGREVNGNEMGPIGYWRDGRMNGIALEGDENGVIKRGYLYEDGEMKRVVQEWELYEMALSGRINYSVIHFFDPDSLFVSDTTTGNTSGFFQLNRRFYMVDWSKDTSRNVMVDMDSKEMTVLVNGERVDLSCTKEVIDLDTNGRRWEGGVKDGTPCGYGVIYDGEGRKEYEGYMMDGVRVCYGIEYFSDIGRVEYEGCYYDDKQFGKGVLYDRNGTIEYQGLWNSNQPYSLHFDGKTIDSHTGCLDVPNDSFHDSTSLILNSFIHSLRRIVIGDDCFGSVRFFELDGLDGLGDIVIGSGSFTIGKDWDTIKASDRTDCSCRIVNCPNLDSIQIGDYSFGDFRSFELKNLPYLETIKIGDNCYDFAPFILADLPKLQSVKLTANAFFLCNSVVFENLPKVQSIRVGIGALQGNGGHDRQTISEEPYNYENTLTMRNLPSLTTFKGEEANFEYIGSVILENIPQLSLDGIQFDYESFQFTYSIQSSSTPSPLSSSFDAPGLEQYLYFGNKPPSTTSHIVKKRSELDSIPLNVEDLWIGRVDTSGITDFSFNAYQSLKSLVIGSGVFWGVTGFELKHLPSLQSIVIGYYCFYWASSFSLADLPQLQSVTLGQYTFHYVQSIAFKNLPSLQSITLGNGALCGDGRDERKTIPQYPYLYKNTVMMLDLPSLTEFVADDLCLVFFGSVILQNIPQLTSDGIHFEKEKEGSQYSYTYALLSPSMHCPILSSFDAPALESFIKSKGWHLK